MKTAYSIRRLGSVETHNVINYLDDFLVCPECHSPVFLVNSRKVEKTTRRLKNKVISVKEYATEPYFAHFTEPNVFCSLYSYNENEEQTSHISADPKNLKLPADPKLSQNAGLLTEQLLEVHNHVHSLICLNRIDSFFRDKTILYFCLTSIKDNADERGFQIWLNTARRFFTQALEKSFEGLNSQIVNSVEDFRKVSGYRYFKFLSNTKEKVNKVTLTGLKGYCFTLSLYDYFILYSLFSNAFGEVLLQKNSSFMPFKKNYKGDLTYKEVNYKFSSNPNTGVFYFLADVLSLSFNYPNNKSKEQSLAYYLKSNNLRLTRNKTGYEFVQTENRKKETLKIFSNAFHDLGRFLIDTPWEYYNQQILTNSIFNDQNVLDLMEQSIKSRKLILSL